MNINLMVVNVGNTRVALGAFVAGELQSVTRLGHDQRDQWAQRIAEVWKELSDTDAPAVAGASVNPAVAEPLEHLIAKITGCKIQWAGREVDLPIKVLTQMPSETGVDRVLNVAAAYEQLGKACIVVDAGTAITIDLCNERGEFVGGAIAPGARIMLAALHEKTACLPQVELARPEGYFGLNTQQAMLHGVYYGIRGMLKEIAENYATSLGTWPEIIGTGGDAATLFGDWELMHAISPDLTLYGIALAYAEHHIRQGT